MPPTDIALYLLEDFSVLFTVAEDGEAVYGFYEKTKHGIQGLLPSGTFPTLADAMEDAWDVFIHEMTPNAMSAEEWEQLVAHAHRNWGKHFSLILEEYRRDKLQLGEQLFGEDYHSENQR